MKLKIRLTELELTNIEIITNKRMFGAVTDPKREINELIERAEFRMIVGYDSTMMIYIPTYVNEMKNLPTIAIILTK